MRRPMFAVALVAAAALQLMPQISLARSPVPSAVPPATIARIAAPGDAGTFLAQTALAASDVPAGLQVLQSSAFSGADLANGDPTTAALLASAGFQGGYGQLFLNSNLVSSFTGAPLVAFTAVSAFASTQGAQAFAGFESSNVSTIVQMLSSVAAAQQFQITVSGVVPLTTASYGDNSAGSEVQAGVGFQGSTIPVVIDLVSVQRGAAAYTVAVVGIQRQQQALDQIASALDSKVAAALPLLGQ